MKQPTCMVYSKDCRRQSEVSGVNSTKICHRQLQLKLAIGIGEISAVQIAHRYVVAISLSGRFECKFHLGRVGKKNE